MAPPRKHETDVILDAARALVLEGGPRAASVAAIAKSSGAPAGTLYHRFGNRDGILKAAWLRALERFQSRAMAASAASTADTPADAAIAMAVAAISFARELPQDARLLLTIRPADLLDEEPDARFQETVATMNAPLLERVGDLARKLYGRKSSRNVDAVLRAVSDLPYAVVRRHAHDDAMPSWLEDDVAATVRAMLESFGERP
ncbi:TetR/AcrR family transcriptional regulator [Mycobacterium sherrisii]|uniref:TetR family transcriptional regulator n=1 Tax=Mycobacterium sherrisii TaxID=243061 RepID=A0A1E3SUL8_9MYCO|nr:TetR/AcrR family transcriptional regulator [Mycobacterium sherrisii]MCV7031265.1 TetR/AcrR family transcriptional regulator [Mycobacterium sherrisii]MEC4763671.1 helix-turn-helix domain-containing protein [Mycobacterium sherrisii]ODR05842.1 TetR family transcriptional regulator [Mycobacterium sherrisii]ORW78259.1 TetR family transcriptional regulator [Mycobacterium sherrisii]